jgi:hypothetical protein
MGCFESCGAPRQSTRYDLERDSTPSAATMAAWRLRRADPFVFEEHASQRLETRNGESEGKKGGEKPDT